MMVEPGRLALTTTPSMFPSSVEDTVPASAAGPSLCAIAGWRPAIGKASRPMLAIAPKDNLAGAFPGRVAVVIEPSRGSAVVTLSLFEDLAVKTEDIASGRTDQGD